MEGEKAQEPKRKGKSRKTCTGRNHPTPGEYPAVFVGLEDEEKREVVLGVKKKAT